MKTFAVILILLLLVAIVVLLAFMLHKIRRIHLQTFELLDHARVTRQETETLFTQLQCLGLLERTLGMPQALPPMRGWAGSPDFLLHTARRALAQRPKVMAECSSGVSTLVLARCAQMNGQGHVYSLEHEAVYAQKTRDMLREHGLDAFATVIDAPLSTKSAPTPWYDEQALPEQMREIELLVVDGPPQAIARLARYPALPRLLPRMAAHFVVLIDDAARPDETEMVALWLREVPGTRASQLQAEKGLTLVER